jgi:hypothetical protein
MKRSHLTVLAVALLLTTVVSARAGEIIVAVPEGGMTLGLLTVGVVAVAGLRRKLGK